MVSKKNILICPLDWGLGHATRCVPIIKKLIESGSNVIIGADGRSYAFLKKEFPLLQLIKFPGYEIKYPEKGSMVLKMLFSIPRILKGIKAERKNLQKLIKENNIDIVISDNRYGLWNTKTKCIFITHQLTIRCPSWLKLFEFPLFLINKHYIKKYDECWIPDLPGDMKLSSDLSKRFNKFNNIYFIGLLSRFSNTAQKPATCINKHDILFILSGPEPQRTIFENIILEQSKKIKYMKMLIVRGITEVDEIKNISENIQLVNHLETEKLANAIKESEIIICRPGYSSIMDIAILGKKAILVPTPGQTEQEHLGWYYKQKNIYYSVDQQNFNIIDSIESSKNYYGIIVNNDVQNLNERIKLLLK